MTEQPKNAACPCGCGRTVKPCTCKVAHDEHCWPLVAGVMSLHWCPGISRTQEAKSG